MRLDNLPPRRKTGISLQHFHAEPTAGQPEGSGKTADTPPHDNDTRACVRVVLLHYRALLQLLLHLLALLAS
jgi:hypothetical protein